VLVTLLLYFGLGIERDNFLTYISLYIIPLLFLMFLNLKYFLPLVLASYPFSLGLLQYELLSVTFSPYIIGMLFMLGLGVVLIAFKLTKYSYSFIDLLVVLLTFQYIATIPFQEDVLWTAYRVLHALIIPIASYFVIKIFVNKEDQFDRCLKYFFLGIGGFALIALANFAVTMERAHILNVPPISAATMAIIPILTIFYSTYRKALYWKIVFVLSLLLLIITFPRVYFISLLLSPFLYYFVRKGYAFLLILLMLSSTLILSISGTVLISKDDIKMKYMAQEKYIEKEKSTERIFNTELFKRAIVGRFVTYRDGIDHFLNEPIFGNGIFKGKLVTYHNYHIEWLAYGGLVGYLLYAAIFLCYFFKCSKAAMYDSFISANLVVILIILLNCTTNGIMHGIMPNAMFLNIAFGLSYTNIKLESI
jgi:hypothetical protein